MISVEVDWLNRLLGLSFAPGEIIKALAQIGCDVEEVGEISRHRCPGCGSLIESSGGAAHVRRCTFCGHEADEPFAAVTRLAVVRLDLLAARPDLFDVGGLARALRGYLGVTCGLPEYPVVRGDMRVEVSPAVESAACFRPYIRCATMTVPPLDEAALVSIMKLQESLHWGIGRDRKLASIGVYDRDTLDGTVHYRTVLPDGETFEPLGMPGRMLTGRQILAEHPKGIAYAHLLADCELYPFLVDGRGRALSMPPIINSESTRLRLGTRRLLVDVTGVSDAAVAKSLNTLVCSLAELGGTIESVEIQAPRATFRSPDLAPRKLAIDLDAARAWLGAPLNADDISHALRRMRFEVQPGYDDGCIVVTYAAFRTDIKHMVDVFEDLAIGIGYDNLEPGLVSTMTVGEARPEERIAAAARYSLLGLGYVEVMNLPLCSEEDSFSHMREPVPVRYVRVSNPKVKGLTVVRSSLLPGLLKRLRENRRRQLPLRLFEIDNIVHLDDGAETGAREERRLAIVDMGKESGFATVRAVVDALLRELGTEPTYAPAELPAFSRGRCASFVAADEIAGTLGELHPEVITGFGLDHPVAAAEVVLARVV